MPMVNASNFQGQIGKFIDIARRESVTVTRHGRPSVVLLAAEDYERLRKIEARATKAARGAELPTATAEAMRTADLSQLPSD
jgi:prevent-host-death family protein